MNVTSHKMLSAWALPPRCRGLDFSGPTRFMDSFYPRYERPSVEWMAGVAAPSQQAPSRDSGAVQPGTLARPGACWPA